MTGPAFCCAPISATTRFFSPAFFRIGSGFGRKSRGFPDLKYYEELGRTHYRIAGEHRLAQRYHLEGILKTLAERFQTTRRALNDMADRLLSIGDPDYPIHTLFGSDKGGPFTPPGQA